MAKYSNKILRMIKDLDYDECIQFINCFNEVKQFKLEILKSKEKVLDTIREDEMVIDNFYTALEKLSED